MNDRQSATPPNAARAPGAEPLDFERVVREVLRRLEQAGGNGKAANGAAKHATGQRELKLNERLVTFERLRDRLDGVRRVIVPHRAIVTPLVRDELKQRGVELCRASDSPTRPHPASPPEAAGDRVVLGVCGADSGYAERAVRSCGARVERVERGEEPRVVERLAEVLQDQRLRGVLVTKRPAAAACLANRSAHVRALCGTCPEELREAVEDLEANLLVVSSSGPDLPNLVRRFLDARPSAGGTSARTWFP